MKAVLRILKWIGLSIAIILLIAGALALYSYFIGARDFVVVEETLRIPNWSSQLNGLRVVAISDIHSGSNYAPEERLRYMVEQANAQQPDLIVLLGDYVSESKMDRRRLNLPAGVDGSELRMSVETFSKIFGGFRAKYGVYAIIGNHDNWHNARKITSAFEQNGIKVLENEVATLNVNGTELHLWGIEDLWKNRRVPTEPIAELEKSGNIIALTHNPDSLLQTPQSISIMFAGHSHGGQMNWPIFGPIAAVNDGRFMDGLAVVDGKHAYVTSGVGTSVIPFRFRVPPEIAVLTLTSAE